MAGQDGGASASRRVWRLPIHASGWWAPALTMVSLVLAWALVTHAMPWSVFDTWVAPVTLAIGADTAAGVALFAVLRRRERSLVTIAALVIAVPMAVFATFMSLVAAWPE